MTRLRSVTGSLAWVARQTRPDLGYRVSRLQSSISGATVAILHDANAVVQLAQQGIENKLIFPGEHLTWGEVGIITVTDASFQMRRTTNHNKDVSISLETSMRSKTPRLHPIG